MSVRATKLVPLFLEDTLEYAYECESSSNLLLRFGLTPVDTRLQRIAFGENMAIRPIDPTNVSATRETRVKSAQIAVMITAREAGEILAVAPRTIYDLASPCGPIPCYRYSARCIRFDRADLEAYIQAIRCEQVVRAKVDKNTGGPTPAAVKARLAAAGYRASVRPVKHGKT